MSKEKKRKLKVDPIKLEEMLSSGMSQGEIARKLGVSDAAISLARKRLKADATRAIVHLQRGGQIIEKNLNAVEQLQKMNSEMNDLLDLLSRWSRGDEEALQKIQRIPGINLRDPRELLVKVAGEIREQILTQLELLKALYDFKAVEEFFDEVIQTIGEADEETKQKIISKLNEKRLVGSIRKFGEFETQTP